MKFVIAGGGIGGLTAALCLAKAGHELTILEQAPVFEAHGAGIQCGANALRVFQHLGLENALQRVAVQPEHIDFLHFQTAERYNRMQLGGAYADLYGAPYLHIHRADLHGVLLDEIQKQPAITLHASSAVASYEESENAVSVVTASGEVFSGDGLIACDGVKSKVREVLFEKSSQAGVAPMFTGNVAWRAVVPSSRLPKDYMDTIACNYVGHRKHAVIYYLRNKELVNFVGVVENSAWREESWVVNSPWEELSADFRGWHPRVRQLIDAMDKEQCFRWALYAHQPFSNWSSKRVTLLGDAAHSTLPFMASGAAMAIEDARVLDRAIAQFSDLAQALQCYQRNRMQRTAKIQAGSEKMGKLYHLKYPFMQRAAFWALRNFAKKQESFLPDYDANSVALL